jgi:hypothetical protein
VTYTILDENLGMCAFLSKMRGCKLKILKFDPGGGQGAPTISDHSQITHFSHSQATTFMDFCEICFLGRAYNILISNL